jgi:hypothetical protein
MPLPRSSQRLARIARNALASVEADNPNYPPAKVLHFALGELFRRHGAALLGDDAVEALGGGTPKTPPPQVDEFDGD